MGVSEEAKPIDLYVEVNFEKLKERAELKHTTISSMKTRASCAKHLMTLSDKIKESRIKRDEEQEFIMLYRYVQLCPRLISTPDDKRSKTDLKLYRNFADKYMCRLEHLKEVLIERYSKKDRDLKELTLNTDSSSTFFNSENKSIIQPEIKGKEKSSDPSQGKTSEFMQCEELYNFLKNYSENISKDSLLIIDCRPTPDFESSRLKYHDLISIPQHTCCRGSSAAVLGLGIYSSESKEKWNKRHLYNTVLLMDNHSTSDSIKNSSSKSLLHINILHEILTKWDVPNQYKNLRFLDGGFEGFEIRYPYYTTNPTENLQIATKSHPDLLKNFKYPEVPEIMPKKPPETPKPVAPTINRQGKPKDLFGLKEFSELEKSKQVAKESGKERGEPAEIVTVNNQDQDQTVRSFNNSDINVTNHQHETILPDPSIMEDGDNKEEETTDIVAMDVDNDESSVHKTTNGKMSSEERANYVSSLRKVKPKSSESTQAPLRETEMDYSSSSEEDERVPLKSDGVGSGMRRSLSSPNIAKENDDDYGSTPSFSRSNKPSYSPRSHITPSLIHGEDPDHVYGSTQLGLTGLKNFANNCYMNSIIQCLSNTAPLVEELTNFKKTVVNMNSTTKGQVAKAFIAALHSIWSGEVRVYSIRELKNLMGSYKEIFKGPYHQDSHEFLIILLEYLHEDLNIPREVTVLTGACDESGEKAWGEFRKKNESVVQRLFYGQERSSVTCTVCNHRSVTFDHFFNLFVPIPDRSDRTTLEECIQTYLSGENIMWTCPNCKVERKAVKKLDITRLPPILIIALKRFSHEVLWLEKKETLVTYPLEGLEMRNFTLPASEQRHTVYNLHALSMHTGSLRAGHYRAICQNHLSNKWYLFDDTSIHSISPQDVRNNPEVYILFYHAVK